MKKLFLETTFFNEVLFCNDPLEQFAISNVSLIHVYDEFITSNAFFSLTSTMLLAFTLLPVVTVCYKSNIFIIVTDILFGVVKTIILDNSNTIRKSQFLNYSFIFIFITILNMSGLIPYSWALTTWFMPVLAISITFFIEIYLIIAKKQQYKFFNHLLPGGTPLMLIPFLVIIEIISFLSRIISISVRLFANMLSGHSLLKILVSFCWAAINLTLTGAVLSFIIWNAITVIFILEITVALLQAYVYTLLLNIYLLEAVESH